MPYIFEPPIAYDNPPTLGDVRRVVNSHAKFKPGQARGRSVLKVNDTFPWLWLFPDITLYPAEIYYITIDTPTIDQVNAAMAAYLGGHIYEVSALEAESLISAGYVVVNT